MDEEAQSPDLELVRLGDRVRAGERKAALGRGKTPECVVLGHVWTDDSGHNGGSICLVCQIIRID